MASAFREIKISEKQIRLILSNMDGFKSAITN